MADGTRRARLGVAAGDRRDCRLRRDHGDDLGDAAAAPAAAGQGALSAAAARDRRPGARRRPTGIAPDLTLLAHFAYGAGCGALIAAANPRIGRVGGALAGGGIWLASYMGWIPAFGVLEAGDRASAAPRRSSCSAPISPGAGRPPRRCASSARRARRSSLPGRRRTRPDAPADRTGADGSRLRLCGRFKARLPQADLTILR